MKPRKKCEAIDLPCHPNPCENGGVCTSDSNGTLDFNCSCPTGFTGSRCQVRDVCTQWKQDVGCEKCVVSEGVQSCRCKKGFYMDAASGRCTSIMEPCYPNPCKNYGLCTPMPHMLPNEYNCTCSEGFLGRTCEEPDHCTLSGGDDFCDDAECQFNSAKKLFYCSCGDDGYFDYASRTCKNVDFCPFMKCDVNEECVNSACRCKEHYKRSKAGKCEANFCTSKTCPLAALKCTNSNDDQFKCSCKKGSSFNGTHCNAAAICTFPSLNDCTQECHVETNKYTCSCIEGFELQNDNKTCTYIGNDTCSNKTCEDSSCLKHGNEELCVCPRGFIERVGRCIDFCSANTLPEGLCPDNSCEPTQGGFRCNCTGKYVLSDDNTTCAIRKMCKKDERGWTDCMRRNAECTEDWNNTEGYTCHCRKGFTLIQGICTDICKVEDNMKTCSELNAECDSFSDGHLCKCPPYFQPFRNGTVCNKPATLSYTLTMPLSAAFYMTRDTSADVRKRSLETEEFGIDYKRVDADVSNTLKEILPGLVHSTVLICRKYNSYLKCKIEMQFSSVIESNLKRLTLVEMCNPANSSNACVLPPSLLLQKNFLRSVVSVGRTDPCDSDIRSHICGTETTCVSSKDSPSLNCTCKKGFQLRSKKYPFGDVGSTIETCNDVDECADTSPCPENMECKNSIGSYSCSCLPGYRLKDDSETNGCVKLCYPSPCVSGECREIGDHGFECNCYKGYTGGLCNYEDKHFKRARTNTIIVGAVLGGALLVTIVLFYVCMNRLKKQNSFDDPNKALYGTEMVERCNLEAGAINNAYQKD